jgi:hypothetical protein
MQGAPFVVRIALRAIEVETTVETLCVLPILASLAEFLLERLILNPKILVLSPNSCVEEFPCIWAE